MKQTATVREEPRYTLGKHERLKNDLIIGRLFQSGLSVSKYPLRFIYQTLPLDAWEDSPVKVSVNASKRGLKSAVKRNRMKRLIREMYRYAKHPLYHVMEDNQERLALSIVYMGKHRMSYDDLEKVFHKLFRKLLIELRQ
jgi:ribonuclease P protein component